MAGSEQCGGEVEQRLEIVDSMHLTEEVAEELAGKLTGPLGLVQDLSYDGSYLIVRWHDGE